VGRIPASRGALVAVRPFVSDVAGMSTTSRRSPASSNTAIAPPAPGSIPRTRPQQANYAILELEHGAISNPDHGSKFGKVAFSDAENAAARRFAEQTVNLNKFGLQFTRESQSL
jgi:hypothetical protein